MAAGTGKRPKAVVVKKAAIENTSTFLQQLPEKQKEDLSLKETIAILRDSLKSALAKGYTYPELAAMLSDKGIKISAFTLKNYVPAGKRRSAKDQTTATPRSGRKQAAKEATGAASAKLTLSDTKATTRKPKASGTSAKAAEAPKGAATGRRTAAAKTKVDSGATVKQTTAKTSRATTKNTTSTKPAPQKTSDTKSSRPASKPAPSRRGKQTKS